MSGNINVKNVTLQIPNHVSRVCCLLSLVLWRENKISKLIII